MNFKKNHIFAVTALFYIFCGLLYSNSVHLTHIDFEITGLTNRYALEQKLHQTMYYENEMNFVSEQAFDSFINELKKQLNNLRAFDSINVITEKDDTDIETTDNDCTSYYIVVQLLDSFHLLALPHVLSYNSNDGWKPKLKVKDMNFLGTLNTLSTDLFTTIQFMEPESENFDVKLKEFGANFNYDFPFRLAIFDATFINNYTFSLKADSDSEKNFLFNMNLMPGIKLSLPKKNYSYDFVFYQQFAINPSYNYLDDTYYCGEDMQFSVPFKICQLDYFGNLSITPYVDFAFYWDPLSNNAINPDNTDLSSPKLTAGFSAGTSRIDWNDNFREGISISFTNSYSYNFQRTMFYPFISSEISFYWNHSIWDYSFLNKFAVNSRLYAFTYFLDPDNPFISKDGIAIGSRLRGIRDEQIYEGTDDCKACLATSAIILNLDFPIRLFTTNFQNGFLRYLNFDMQFSPFIDIALLYNKVTKRIFNPKDGFYTAGFEILVYPAKWSSFTVRGSIGWDIGKILFSNQLDTSWRSGLRDKAEISIGIGLQY